MPIKIIKDSWKRLWNAEEIRLLVLASLCLQIGLVFLSPWRKRTARKPLIVLLWCFYQAADYIPILALSDILKKQNKQGAGNLMAFWAPFFLLHLGGPDTITSYSIEDNELWLRHFIALVVQASIAFLVLLGLLAVPRLCLAAAIVFFTGFVKYAERILALRSASMDQLRDSLFNDHNPGPNYAEFVKEFVWLREAGQGVQIRKIELPQPSDYIVSRNNNDVNLIVKAYESFRRFKPNLLHMIVGGDKLIDLMLNFEDLEISKYYFWGSTVSYGFKVVEMELSFLYDVFHTKAIHIRCMHGTIWRFITLGMISVACILFHSCEKQAYVNADIVISYILLGSTLIMELTSLILIATSDWMIVALAKQRWLNLNKLAGGITCAVSCIFSKGKPRWSNSMSQYNLLSLSLGDKEKPFIIRWLLGFIKVKKLPLEKKVKELWNDYIFVTSLGVPSQLKALLFDELKKKSQSAHQTDDFKEFRYCKGEKALKEEECSHLTWTFEKEFDESIVLWHIATDLCFHIYGDANDKCETGQGVVEHIKCFLNSCGRNEHIRDTDREISFIMSNYMMYLLIMQTSMMPAGIRKISFNDTCAEAKLFFRAQKNKGLNEAEVRKALLNVDTEVDPIEVKGDRCKSVLFEACRLAKELNLLPEDDRWRLVRKVWVEMLGYAAINCKTNYHVKQLSQGGELLTHIWLLMAHMGIGVQYRAELLNTKAILAFDPHL